MQTNNSLSRAPFQNDPLAAIVIFPYSRAFQTAFFQRPDRGSLSGRNRRNDMPSPLRRSAMIHQTANTLAGPALAPN